MAALHELIQKIENPELRAQIQEAADRLTSAHIEAALTNLNKVTG